MTAMQVKDFAKELVLSRGPAVALEFTTELMGQDGVGEDHPQFGAVYAEVSRQAIRVYHFMGYEAPFGAEQRLGA